MVEFEFTKRSREIVERFLQSAVIVDDYAVLDKPVESAEQDSDKELCTPPQRPGMGSTTLVEEVDKEASTEQETEDLG